MPTAMHSHYFIEETRLPKVDMAVPFRQAYRSLQSAGVGAFLLVEAGRPKAFIRGFELAVAAINNANGNSTVIELVTQASIGRVISDCMSKSPDILVPLHPNAVDVTKLDTFQSEGDTVYEVVEMGNQIGWLFSNEGVRDSFTKKTFFTCVNGHRNLDPDHGTCYQCPFPIEAIG